MLKEVKKRMEAQNIKIEIEDDVKDKIIEKGSNTNYGARPLKRTIQNMLENRIAEYILNGKVKGGETVKIGINKEEEIEIK